MESRLLRFSYVSPDAEHVFLSHKAANALFFLQVAHTHTHTHALSYTLLLRLGTKEGFELYYPPLVLRESLPKPPPPGLLYRRVCHLLQSIVFPCYAAPFFFVYLYCTSEAPLLCFTSECRWLVPPVPNTGLIVHLTTCTPLFRTIRRRLDWALLCYTRLPGLGKATYHTPTESASSSPPLPTLNLYNKSPCIFFYPSTFFRCCTSSAGEYLQVRTNRVHHSTINIGTPYGDLRPFFESIGREFVLGGLLWHTQT